MSNTNRGRSYKDPLYDQIEAKLEAEYGLPTGGMSAIRTRGERSNANQVSSAGARSVYQIIPSTRDAFKRRYGVDAYASPEDAARVAALHLRDSMRRNGNNWEAAVGEYHGGPDRRNWGPVNRSYRQRVLGGAATGGGTASAYEPVAVPKPKLPTVSEMLGSTPGAAFGEVAEELREIKRTPKPKLPSVSELTKGMLTEGMTLAPVDDSATGTELEQRTVAEQAQAETEAVTHWDRFKAGMQETLLGELIEALDRQSY